MTLALSVTVNRTVYYMSIENNVPFRDPFLADIEFLGLSHYFSSHDLQFIFSLLIEMDTNFMLLHFHKIIIIHKKYKLLQITLKTTD
jgi:hypothetical protein